jgi:hypothetical protein
VGGDVKATSVVEGKEGKVEEERVGKVVFEGRVGKVFVGRVGKVLWGKVGIVVGGRVGKVLGGTGDDSKANFVVVSCPWSSQAVRILFGGGRDRDGKKL